MRQLVEKTPAHARHAQASVESLEERKVVNRQAVLTLQPTPQHTARSAANSGFARPTTQHIAVHTVTANAAGHTAAAHTVAAHAAAHTAARVAVRPVTKQPAALTSQHTKQPAKDKTFTERFERKEDKYLLSAEQFRRLLEVASGYLKPDEHGQTQVRSLYYDTPEYEIIERSLDKPTYKEKLRVRSYGLPTETSPVFVEIKKKFKSVVYKRRVCMTSTAASRYLEGMPYRDAYLSAPLAEPYSTAQAFSPIAMQTVKEIDVFLMRHGGLQPSMLILCDRRAYVDPEGSGLRITFDSNITADPTASDLFGSDGMGGSAGSSTGGSAGGGLGAANPVNPANPTNLAKAGNPANPANLVNPATPIIHPSETLMEIKSEGSLPLWLVQLLSECKVYPQSFSKYGNAYLMLCRDKVYGGR